MKPLSRTDALSINKIQVVEANANPLELLDEIQQPVGEEVGGYFNEKFQDGNR
jgi:hypothetical protein